MDKPTLEADDPRELIELPEPDGLGASSWVYVYTDDLGNVVERSEARYFSADGYDATGNRVAGRHGVIDNGSSGP